MLINLTSHADAEILAALSADDEFIETLVAKVTAPTEPNANEIAMLLANMVKCDDMKKLLTLERKKGATTIPAGLTQSTSVLDQLFDCFVKGADGKYNPKADFDYLAYVFADLSKVSEDRSIAKCFFFSM